MDSQADGPGMPSVTIEREEALVKMHTQVSLRVEIMPVHNSFYDQ